MNRFLQTCAFLLANVSIAFAAQLPSYTGEVQGDATKAHDGGLRWAVGVQNVQVARSAPANPSKTDGDATVYRHHPFLAYWGGLFWLMHDASEARISRSANGLDWNNKESSKVFEGTHHRMAFFVASNGRFLASHWVGVKRGAEGVRLVREILGPDSYGTIYTIKTNYVGSYPGKDWPSYTVSSDSGFKAACEEMLNGRLFRQQWQEEDQDPDFYTVSRVSGNSVWKAFSWYRLPDKRIVGTWKGVYQTVSTGSDWNPGHVPDPMKVTSFGYSPSAKTWGALTDDGRYAMVGCVPGGDLHKRWPLAVTTSADGMVFNTAHMVIAGDMPVQRYENANGDDKNSGPQYVRGIVPGNGNPPGTDLWLTYSMHKEDIWVACVPTPIQAVVTGNVKDDFQNVAPGRLVPGWNTYSPQWAPVAVMADDANRFVRLEDRDPCDYASVMRVFPKSTCARLAFQVRAHQAEPTSAPLEIDVVSNNGARAVALSLNPMNGQITAQNDVAPQSVASYPRNAWIGIELVVDGATQRYSLRVNGKDVLTDAAFLEAASSIERIVFRTGPFRLRDSDRRPFVDGTWLTDRVPDADVPQTIARYDLDNVVLAKQTS